MMTATDHLFAAYSMAMARNNEIHSKWISISHKLGPIAGFAHIMALQRNGRLDLMLRLIEAEQAERLARINDETSSNPIWSLDLQCALSENWILSAYEVARAAKRHFKTNFKLQELARRLALVRMPIAKGSIQGMDRSEHKKNPPVLVTADGNEAKNYLDGGYLMPSGLCAETGAVLWCPVDLSKHQTVAMCRRDLSDEMLALFD